MIKAVIGDNPNMKITARTASSSIMQQNYNQAVLRGLRGLWISNMNSRWR